MTDVAKIQRGNLLSLLWQDMFAKKIATIRNYKMPLRSMGFLGQHNNPLRQEKNRVMREKGITGKQYRRLMKAQRRAA